MVETSKLGLTLLEAAQSQKHITVNEALKKIDAILQLSVKAMDLTTPPVSPVEGDSYIPVATATGAWEGWEGKVVSYIDGTWVKFDPVTGWKMFNQDDGTTYVYTGATWDTDSASSVTTANGGLVRFRAVETELTLSGATGTATDFIPDRAIVLGVASRTTEEITGATSYDVGVSGEANKFGGTLGIAAGSTNIGVVGPTAYYADTDVIVTANGSDFTGGKVRLILYYIETTAPSS